eukprot:tig00020876_g14842.t1
MPAPRLGHCLTVFNSSVWVTGGCSAGRFYADLLRWSPSSGWVTEIEHGASIFPGLTGALCARLSSRWYIYSGVTSSLVLASTIYEVDLSDSRLRPRAFRLVTAAAPLATDQTHFLGTCGGALLYGARAFPPVLVSAGKKKVPVGGSLWQPATEILFEVKETGFSPLSMYSCFASLTNEYGTSLPSTSLTIFTSAPPPSLDPVNVNISRLDSSSAPRVLELSTGLGAVLQTFSSSAPDPGSLISIGSASVGTGNSTFSFNLTSLAWRRHVNLTNSSCDFLSGFEDRTPSVFANFGRQRFFVAHSGGPFSAAGIVVPVTNARYWEWNGATSCLDVNTGTVSERTARARISPVDVVYGGTYYVAGGLRLALTGATSFTASVLSYKPGGAGADGTWAVVIAHEAVSGLQQRPTCRAQGAAFDGKLFYYGGLDSRGQVSDQLFYADIASSRPEWVLVAQSGVSGLFNGVAWACGPLFFMAHGTAQDLGERSGVVVADLWSVGGMDNAAITVLRVQDSI